MASNSGTMKGARGQTIKTATGRDDSSYPLNDKESRQGKEMGGSMTDVSHSLSGASAVQHVKGG